MSFPLSEYTKSMSAGALPQTPLGELTALPRPSIWFQGDRFAAGREGREGLREGKGEMGKGGERGKLGEGNSALVVGG